MKLFKYVVPGFFAIGCIAAMPSCKSGSQDHNAVAIDLKMDFKEGDKYLYTTKINQNIVAPGISMDQKMTMEMIHTAKGEVSGNKAVDITYDHIVIEVNSPSGGMKFDSKNPSPNDAMGLNIMDSLIGKTFGVTVAGDGHIVDVTGMDKIINSFNLDNDPKQAAIKSQLNDTAIRMMMQNSFNMYPGHSVKVGDTWNRKEKMTFSGLNVSVDNTYKLISVEDGKANLTLSSILELPKAAVGDDSTAPQMELNGKQTGNIQMDIATGQVLNSQIHSDIKGKMVLKAGPQDIGIKGTIIVTSKKM